LPDVELVQKIDSFFQKGPVPASGTNVLENESKASKRKLSDPRKWRDTTRKDGCGAVDLFSIAGNAPVEIFTARNETAQPERLRRYGNS
jgi:hypothetical protein